MEIMKEALLRHLDRARQSLWDPNKNEHRFGTGFIDPQQIQSAKVVMGAQGARPGQRPNGIDMVLTVPGDELSYSVLRNHSPGPDPVKSVLNVASSQGDVID
ncbi:hypothetical protein EV421DRAFT_2025178 [Armillaria borealis]|uniref:Uncharacterized protein n=1 Tax=Armillaria borealis TaxID=47425 RepID=A0AA39IVL8_9AGAR|nr:hypothetical protein EV421DRAFT_2025178 [Armillaria borealis]